MHPVLLFPTFYHEDYSFQEARLDTIILDIKDSLYFIKSPSALDCGKIEIWHAYINNTDCFLLTL